MEFMTKLRRYFFPNSPMTYEEIRATYNVENENYVESPDQTSTTEVIDATPFVERAKKVIAETREKKRQQRDTELKAKFNRISAQLYRIASQVKEDIFKDARGEGPFGIPTGFIRYTIEDYEGIPAMFMVGDEKKIKSTPGYEALEKKCKELGLTLAFKTDFGERCKKQPEDCLLPTAYHIDVVISGW